MKQFDDEVCIWEPVTIAEYGKEVSDIIVRETRREFEEMIPQIPYIGGDANRRTETLVQSVRFLAFYLAMDKHDKSLEETGKILWDALITQIDKTHHKVFPDGWENREEYFDVRRQGAEDSQERRYSSDYVYEFVMGNGEEFDYGYDYTECATGKFFNHCQADEFTPYYCYLDYPLCAARGLGLSRTKTLVAGYDKCNHRFSPGRETPLIWPPAFLQSKDKSKTYLI